MRETLLADLGDVADRLRADPLGLVAAASVVLLCILVAAAGAVAVLAETVGTWRTLFFMEQTFAFVVPVVKGLLALSVVASVGLVVRTD